MQPNYIGNIVCMNRGICYKMGQKFQGRLKNLSLPNVKNFDSKPESIIKKLISDQTDVLKESPQYVKTHISNNISNP